MNYFYCTECEKDTAHHEEQDNMGSVLLCSECGYLVDECNNTTEEIT